MTWNGTTITGPVLIYSDEILQDTFNVTGSDPGPGVTIGDPNRPGALICRSEERAQVGWDLPSSFDYFGRPIFSAYVYVQVRTGASVIPSLSRLYVNIPSIVERGVFNGLWLCRLNASPDGEVHVGIFARGEVVTFYVSQI